MTGSLTPAQTLSILQSLGHHPNKKLGQNFLIDKNIVKKSIALSQVNEDDHIIEVGPGLGTLSSAILETGATLYAVEKDKTLAQYLNENLVPRFPDTFHLLNADALDHPLAELPENITNFKIVANLPYAIATPWLESIINDPLPLNLTLMLQKEAADRFCAPHGSKAFAPISIFLNSAFNPVTTHKVSRHCFYPEPNVDSTLLLLEKKPSPFIFKPTTRHLIRAFFTQRRKQIQSLCKQQPEPNPLNAWLNILNNDFNLPPSTRPESIPIPAWQKLDALL